MTTWIATLVFGLFAYLIGSIPFGYLIPRLLKGIDIRTVGSGNIGATNVGRALGFRYFVLVTLLDAFKGFLPTFYASRAVISLTGSSPPEAPVLAMTAAILGHNFPIYLRFKGGKGVATSLGSVIALDPAAGLIAAVGFLFTFVTTRVVSISSILGGASFLGAYFTRVPSAWDRAHALTTIALLCLFALLVARHRSNLKRLWQGTEPRIPFRRSPKGSARATILLTVSIVGLGGAAAAWHGRPRPVGAVHCGPYVFEELARIGTGHQRAEDLVFSSDGTCLAVACPRYQRLLFYHVQNQTGLSLIRDVALDGRPVALATYGGTFFVLERPHGDARHLEEGYFETFGVDGIRIGSKTRVGWDPDDIAISPNGSHAFVLTSGKAEGESNRPPPALHVYALGSLAGSHRLISRLEFGESADDPAQIQLSNRGEYAAVSLNGSQSVAAIDLRNPAEPVVIARTSLSARELPTLSPTGTGDEILMPVATERKTVWVRIAPSQLLIATVPEGSALEVVDAIDRRLLGSIPLRAAGGWNDVRPVGIAASPDSSLLAVASRSGGVHLLSIRLAR
jgi:acyl-phosphate glycerol 3-phosphate acyltransferase